MVGGDESVFEGAHLRAYLMAGRNDRLMVTFDHRQTGRTDFNPHRHSSSFARRGFWQLSIKSRANDWFINEDTPALERALEGLRGRFARVGLLGFSMGGYGALRFARALGADQAVLVSPQVSIAPQVVPFETRYRAEAGRFDAAAGDLARVACPQLRGLILVDPFVGKDMRHAQMILALFPGLELARLAFAGHPATQVIRGAGKVWTVQHAASAAGLPARGPICAAHRAGRRGQAGYWERLAARAGERRPGLAAEAAARAGMIAS